MKCTCLSTFLNLQAHTNIYQPSGPCLYTVKRALTSRSANELLILLLIYRIYSPQQAYALLIRLSARFTGPQFSCQLKMQQSMLAFLPWVVHG